MRQRTNAKTNASRRVAMRRRRHLRIRRKVSGTPERPRLAVHRSLKNVVGQIIDDSRGVTLVGVSSSDPGLAVAPAQAAGGSSAAHAAAAAEPTGGKGGKKHKKAAQAAGPATEGAKAARARAAGRALAERARAKGIQRVVFDRGGYVYHGRVKAFAEGAREGGLEF